MSIAGAARRVLLAVTLPITLVAGWWILSDNSTSAFAPPLRTIVSFFDDTWLHGRLRSDALPSLLRLLVGYLLAVALGVAVGIPVGASRTLRGYLEPVLEFFRAIPPPVLVPVLMLFAGIGNTMKVLVIVSGCVWPVLLNTVQGVRSIDATLSDAARCYGITGAARLRHLTVRGASPQIFTGARQALSVGIILMVISEMVAANNGLGFTIVQFQRSFAIPEMWTGIILLGTIGVLLSLVFRLVESRMLAWYFNLRRAQRGSS
jgi:ABC-type nitrate/sulfonate/bicarbonate transport system permease component